jgi:hypothetical protein
MSDVHTIMQIPVYDGARLHGYAEVWSEDWADLMTYLWKLSPEGYAVRYSKAEGTVRMARQIMGLATGDPRQVDHMDRHLLNNCRSNLRITTLAQNQQNRSAEGNKGSSSRHRGVSRCKQTQRWVAQCCLYGQRHWLGRYDTEEEAARVAREFREKHMTHTLT